MEPETPNVRGMAAPTSTPDTVTERRDANQPPLYGPVVTPTPNAKRPKPARRDNAPSPIPNAPAPEPTDRPDRAIDRLKREDATRLAFARHEYPRVGRAMAQRICLHRQDFQTPLVGKRGKKRGA